ncbi:hypothetical protein BDZ94DRAFT_1123640, partial [Collybia nuda]
LLQTSLVGRQVQLLVSNMVLGNKLDTIIAATPVFVVCDALMDNINSYVIAVLLSAKLSAYKGDVPRDLVIAIITQNRLHIPNNIDADCYAMNKVKLAVQGLLTQARSWIKKCIKASKAGGESQNIFDLATKVV